MTTTTRLYHTLDPQRYRGRRSSVTPSASSASSELRLRLSISAPVRSWPGLVSPSGNPPPTAPGDPFFCISMHFLVYFELFCLVLLNRPKSPISLSTCGVLLEKGNSFAGLTSIESLDGSDK